MKRILPLVVACLAFLLTTAVGAAPPETLRLNDLTNRAERWPETVTLSKAFNFAGGMSAKAGQEVAVLEFNGREVLVDAGGGLVFRVAPGDCNLLDAANAAWAALAPEQRAVDAQALVQDPSLWPDTVASTIDLDFQSGEHLKKGTLFNVLDVQRDGAQLYAPEHDIRIALEFSNIDIIQRARERALVAPEQRSSRIVSALRGSLVDAQGKAYADERIDDTQVFALLFSASWCGPCRQFSPGFIEYINSVQDENPRLMVVLMSNDQEVDKMYGYMREEGMPWPAMTLETLTASPVLMRYSGRGIPHLVILDRHGKVLATSHDGRQYLGVQPPFNTLKQLVKSGATR